MKSKSIKDLPVAPYVSLTQKWEPIISPTPAKERNAKWDESMYVRCYQLAREGFSDTQIAQNIGIDKPTIIRWKKIKPYFSQSLKMARDSIDNAQTFEEYVYRRLPRALQQTWDQIHTFSKSKSALRKIKFLLADHGKQERQSLYIHALISKNFNASEACRCLDLSYKQVTNWSMNDPYFLELLTEIDWHKKNFFESHLIKLVKTGDVAATIFANKTKNRDRGYAEKIEHEVSGTVHHTHAFDIEVLNLPLSTKRTILEAIEAHEQKLNPRLTHAKTESDEDMGRKMSNDLLLDTGKILDTTAKEVS